MSEVDRAAHRDARYGPLRAGLVSLSSFLRHLPLLFRPSPKTPLRILCIMALDTLHVLRHSRRLPRQRVGELATFLDFQACTNAVWDQKDLCDAEYRAMRQRLENAGLGARVEEYLDQLGEIERRRPPIGGDGRRFDEVRSYREAVARVSLAAVTAIALDGGRLDDETRATQCDGDVGTLFRIVMQCQIIDDVLDYTVDIDAGLPSFLTACGSLTQAMALTAQAARDYAISRERSSSDGAFPLRLALSAVTAVTTLVVRVASPRHTGEPVGPPPSVSSSL